MKPKEIRNEVKRREGVRKVRIARNGDIIATGTMPRGDGGRKVWSMYVGNIRDAEYQQ